jgi:hypothetical protein
LARSVLVQYGAEDDLGISGMVGRILQKRLACWTASGCVYRGVTAWITLTYLARTPSEGGPQRAERFVRVRLVGARALPIQIAPRAPPGEIVDDGEVAAPEDGGAVRDGEDARVDEAGEGEGPGIAGPESCLRPGGL